MNDKMTEVLEQIAIKLGVTADHLWGVMIAQQRIDAVLSAGFVIFVCAFYWYYIRFARRAVESTKKKFIEAFVEPEVGVPVLILGIIGLSLFPPGLIAIDNAITAIINPEFGALKDLLNMMSGLK